MKKDLQKLAIVTLAALIGVTTRSAFSQENNHETSPMALQEGKAMLAVDDLKVLLGLPSRIPSSGESTDAPATNAGNSIDSYKFALKMDPSSKRTLSAKISHTEMERTKESAQAEKELSVEKEKLKKQRHSLQMRRIQTDNQEIQKELFENLLAEANLKAKHQQKLAALAQKHAVTITFLEMNGEKVINSVEMAGMVLWSKNAADVHVAKN